MTESQNGVRVRLETSAGNMTLELLPSIAPKHVENFVKLSQDGFYDGTKFHRVVTGFMIQGGDPNTKTGNERSWGTGGPGWTVDAEFNDMHHERGVVSMARSSDPNSAGSQFFLMHGEAEFLDGKYTAFGRIVDGFDVLDTIANADTMQSPGGENSKPLEPVTVHKAIVEEA
ncbi:Putative peptidyl-prolyl cis-trans isomerase [Planctomycetes bacterium Poly30]|uniref:Peptidyl-prolyl cis-trans isomerase n=1 Tax=Saltatorellus ferox TaxID=2528018 RepID=A0A518EY18_9BACT|nr:Putative peptidyl-prolyl cis-trans isomerase [Planctomycetes bacterium Poly30]